MRNLPEAARALIPGPFKRRLRYVLETRRRIALFGRQARFVPAVQDMFDGPQSLEEFRSNGREFLEVYRQFCGLQPDERMLDLGCGIGRKTLPLLSYFGEQARYEGLDIVRPGIEWCTRRITPKYPNFRFQLADVYNKLYNPNGTVRPSDFAFPFGDESFTFVMLGSVFTHMLPEDIEHYLLEVHRVLKTGGRCLITFFLLNEEALTLIAAGRSSLDFRWPLGNCRVASEAVPEEAVAVDHGWVEETYRKTGLEIVRAARGSWCGREQHLSYQDLILAVKR